MPTEDFTDGELEMLRRRWQEEPSAHLSLQLADLYRRRGQVADGVSVLEHTLLRYGGSSTALLYANNTDLTLRDSQLFGVSLV